MNKELYLEQCSFLSSSLKGSTIMISGSTGLIGSRIVNYLCELNDLYEANIKIVALYKDEKKKNSLFEKIISRNDVAFVENDISKPIDFAGNVDYVVHCAGISGGTKMHLKNPMYVFEVAYNGTKNLLDFSVAHGVKGFCFVSTYEIYGAISQEELISESTPCRLDPMVLRNIYAECKRMSEAMCVAVGSTCNMNVYVGRLTSTFGEGVKYDDPRFFAEFARCIIAKKDIVLKSMGGTVRSYLDADDAARAFLYILVRGEKNTAYNITNMDNAISIRDIATKMIALAGSQVELKFDVAEDVAKLGFRAEGTTLMDASRLCNLGWSPVYTIDDTLTKLLRCIEEQS